MGSGDIIHGLPLMKVLATCAHEVSHGGGKDCGMVDTLLGGCMFCVPWVDLGHV